MEKHSLRMLDQICEKFVSVLISFAGSSSPACHRNSALQTSTEIKKMIYINN